MVDLNLSYFFYLMQSWKRKCCNIAVQYKVKRMRIKSDHQHILSLTEFEIYWVVNSELIFIVSYLNV